MRAALDKLAAWSTTIALLAGLCLPMTARFDVTDADGVCGPTLVVEPSTAHVEEAQAGPQGSHCVLCHLRHDLAGAFVSTVVQVASPVDAALVVAGRPTRGPNFVVVGHTSPRGPPATT